MKPTTLARSHCAELATQEVTTSIAPLAAARTGAVTTLPAAPSAVFVTSQARSTPGSVSHLPGAASATVGEATIRTPPTSPVAALRLGATAVLREFLEGRHGSGVIRLLQLRRRARL